LRPSKPHERGSDVTLVDKSYAGKAGSTHFSEGDVVYFRPERGPQIEEWLKVISSNCEYLNNQEWNEICLKRIGRQIQRPCLLGSSFHLKDGELYIFSGIGRGHAHVI
jgi:hypothetical protein